MATEETERLTPQADFELDTFTVVVLHAGPRAAEYDRAETQRLLNEHLQYTLGLRRAGHLLAAGAILDQGPPADRQTGLGFSLECAAELLPRLNEDPAVKAGLEAVKLVTLICPKGAIAFQRPPT